MATNFKLKRSSVANKRPGLTNLELGELALNTYDGFLFTERNGLGITTVANITPWYENYGAESIFYTNRVGIGTTAVPATNQLLVKGGTETDRLNVTGVSTFHDNVRIVDTKSLLIGDHTNGDLSFVHDGNNSVIRNRTGDLYVSNASQNYFQLVGSTGAVKVNYGGNLKLETTNTGITVTGHVEPATDSLYDLGSSSKYWRNLYVDSITGGGGGVVIGDDIITRNLKVTGISTFVGIITASATENIIPFLYSNYSDLPSASSYHGAFAHVHSVGKAFFAHAGAWMEIVSKETNGTVGSGTERYNVGAIDGTSINITGISTFKGDVNLGDADTDNIVFGGDVNSHIIPNTNVTYDLGSTTKRWRTLYTGASTKIDSDIITRNLSVTGLGTFANDVTFTGASYNAVWDQSDSALEFADNAKVKFGDSGDLDIYHSGNGSFIRDTGTGPLTILTNHFLLRNAGNNEELIEAFENSSVSLFYDDTKRLSTSGVGVTVYNQLDVTNINASGIITAVDGNFTGNVSIGGTLTYQDVTNVDSIGIATARVGLDVLSGGINAVGIVTADGLDAIGIQSGGVNITTGIITAINFTGTGNTVTYDSSTKIVSVSVGSAGAGGKFVENNTGIHTLSNVGIGTTNASDKLKVLGDVAFTGALKVSSLGLSGSNGQFLKSVGTGVTWSSFPTARTVGLQTATANQTSFSFAYNVGFLDVYINGVKLTSNEFTATNGTSVVLTEGAFVGDQVQFISFNTTATGGGGGGSGISDVVQDATPQLGGNLDLNSKTINGSGNIDYTGNFKASGISTLTRAFVTDLSVSGVTTFSDDVKFDGATAGRDITFDRSSNRLNFADSADATFGNSNDLLIYHSGSHSFVQHTGSGNLQILGNNIFLANGSGSEQHIAAYANNRVDLYFNNSVKITTTNTGAVVTGILTANNVSVASSVTANKFYGDGSALTGISGSGGVTVQDEGSALSTTGTTLNFVGAGVVATGSGSTKTITIAGGGSGVTVQDEGSSLSTAGTTLNFVGSGVVASGSGATKTITIAGGGSGTNPGFSTAGGNFTVNAGVTTVIDTFNINTNTKLSEYTVQLENVNGNIQSQKVLVMNYGAGLGLTAYSSEYGIMFHPNQIADIGVVVTAGICSLTATTKTGITGITTFSLTRQDQS